jgi:outer membrane biosynthesis protein TonB
MTPRDSSARERRAASREQRRSSTDAPERAQDGAHGDGPGAFAGDALKAAASAAAVGAAVGAARALSARRRHANEDDKEDEVEAQEPEAAAEEPTQEPEEREEPEEPKARREPEPEPEPEPEQEASVEPASPSDLQTIVRQAREVLRELHGTDAETVSSVAHTAHGWVVGLEVVELRRIPDSTDILATYEVELDGDGGVLRVERKRRYHRAEADREGR